METKTKTVREAMHKALSTTMENVFFAEVEPAPQNFPTNIWTAIPYHKSRIHIFSGGFLTLVLPVPLLEELQDLFSATHPEIRGDAHFLADTAAETLNQFAGQFMTELLGDARTYHLGLPRVFQSSFNPVSYDSVYYFRINRHICAGALQGDPSREIPQSL